MAIILRWTYYISLATLYDENWLFHIINTLSSPKSKTTSNNQTKMKKNRCNIVATSNYLRWKNVHIILNMYVENEKASVYGKHSEIFEPIKSISGRGHHCLSLIKNVNKRFLIHFYHLPNLSFSLPQSIETIYFLSLYSAIILFLQQFQFFSSTISFYKLFLGMKYYHPCWLHQKHSW